MPTTKMPTTKSSTTTKATAPKKATRSRKSRTKKTAQPPTVPCYRVAAVRGIQAEKEYYSLMMPLRMLTQSFLSTTEEMPASMRSQRLPNPRRIKQIASYITDN